jgi:hypothetical protein
LKLELVVVIAANLAWVTDEIFGITASVNETCVGFEVDLTLVCKKTGMSVCSCHLLLISGVVVDRKQHA